MRRNEPRTDCEESRRKSFMLRSFQPLEVCRWRDSNPHGTFVPTDFKSVASAVPPHRLASREAMNAVLPATQVRSRLATKLSGLRLKLDRLEFGSRRETGSFGPVEAI